MKDSWVPGADAEALEGRARLLRAIREFFHLRHVMEVVTPVMGARGVTDVHIENVRLTVDGALRFLQTSPEYFLKRLLAAGSGPVYQMGPVFRGRESGVRHNIEFTMLEWYRPGFTLEALIAEVEALLGDLARAFGQEIAPFQARRYKDLFNERWGSNPLRLDKHGLRQLAESLPHGHIVDHDDDMTSNDYLDLLFSQGIEPSLAEPRIVTEYPATQAALAEIGVDADGDRVGQRFECFWQGVELANGYLELRDADELRDRMNRNNNARRLRGLAEIEPDEKLLAALPHMPPACGVAMGIDRLLMLLLGRKSLDDVIAFGDKRL